MAKEAAARREREELKARMMGTGSAPGSGQPKAGRNSSRQSVTSVKKASLSLETENLGGPTNDQLSKTANLASALQSLDTSGKDEPEVEDEFDRGDDDKPLTQEELKEASAESLELGSNEKGLSATMSSKDLSAMLAASAEELDEPDAQEESPENTDDRQEEEPGEPFEEGKAEEKQPEPE